MVFNINAQIGGVSTPSSQVTPEFFYCRSIGLIITEKKSNMHNVTQPISNSKYSSEMML